jgi:hypothetical protein
MLTWVTILANEIRVFCTYVHTYTYCSIVILSTTDNLLGVIPSNCSRAKTFQAVDQMVLGQGAVAHGLRSRRQQVVSVAKSLVVLVELVQVRVLNLKENCMLVAVPDESMGVQNRPLQNSSTHTIASRHLQFMCSSPVCRSFELSCHDTLPQEHRDSREGRRALVNSRILKLWHYDTVSKLLYPLETKSQLAF